MDCAREERMYDEFESRTDILEERLLSAREEKDFRLTSVFTFTILLALCQDNRNNCLAPARSHKSFTLGLKTNPSGNIFTNPSSNIVELP